jgi:hypothetical protein
MQSSRRIAVIDFELVFDIWSLLFCCIRWHRPSLKTSDYSHLLYHPVSSAIRATLEDGHDLVASKFEELLLSTKPWIPAF